MVKFLDEHCVTLGVENLYDKEYAELVALSVEIFGSGDFISHVQILPSHNKLVKEFKQRANEIIMR